MMADQSEVSTLTEATSISGRVSRDAQEAAMKFRVTPALRQLLWSQIECRTDPNESPGITVYAKLGCGAPVVFLTPAEVRELREELLFWLDPEQEKYPGEAVTARAALKQLRG